MKLLSLCKNRNKAKFNLYYFLYCLYELRYGKIFLHNGGYSPSNLTDDNAYQLQLYLELMAAGQITQSDALNLCDIGCGQGHGTVFLLQNYLNKQCQITGLDISEVAIGYCKWKYRKLKNAVFKLNGSRIPFVDQTVDVFLSIGSGVPNSAELLRDIYRCLKPTGVFVFYETYETLRQSSFDAKLSQNGFAIVKKENVTTNLIDSLIADNQIKKAQLAKLWFLPKKLLAFLDNYAATVGSAKFADSQNNKLNSFIYVLHKLPDFIFGHVETWDGRHLKGWAFCANHTQPVALQIVADGKIIAETMADLPREDVAAAHGEKRMQCGFFVALPLLTIGDSYTVDVVETKTQQKIFPTSFLIKS